jgi:hypothetical protein
LLRMEKKKRLETKRSCIVTPNIFGISRLTYDNNKIYFVLSILLNGTRIILLSFLVVHEDVVSYHYWNEVVVHCFTF